MSFADSAYVEIGYIEESTWGTTPSTPELVALRLLNENLKKNLVSVVSNEIRSDRQIPDAVVVGGDAGGDIAFELSFGAFTTFFEHLLMKTKVVGQTITGTDLSLSGSQLLSGSNAFELTKNVVNQWIRITGSASGGNGIYRISSATTGALSLLNEDGTTASFTAESANASLSYKSSTHIKNGTVKKSLTIEKGSTDVGKFQQFRGMRVGAMELTMATRAIIEGKFTLLGKGVTTSNATIDNDGQYTASASNTVLNASDHLRKIWYDGIESTQVFKNMSINVDNGLRAQDQIGSADLAGVGVGRFNGSGNVEAYFQDFTMYDAFMNNQYKNFVLLFDDDSTSAEGNLTIFTFPRVKFMDASVETPGVDSDLMVPLDFQMTRDPSLDYTVMYEELAV